MQLNEIIEENTLEEISQKTRLSSENLEKIFSKKFEELRKVQAMGFISILEREYHADLSDLRAECMAFYSASSPEAEQVAPKKAASPYVQKMETAQDLLNGYKSFAYLKPIVIGLLILGIVYGAWQALSSSAPVEMNQTQSAARSGFFTAIVDQARSWMDGTDMPEDTTIPLENNETDTPEEESSNNQLTLPRQTSQGDEGDAAAEADRSVPPAAPDTHADNETSAKPKAEAADTLVPQTDENLQGIIETGNAIAHASEENRAETPLAPQVPSMAEAGEDNALLELPASRDGVQEEKPVPEKSETNTISPEKIQPQQETEVSAIREQAAAEEQAAKEKAAREEAARKKAAAEKAAREQAAREKAAKEKMAKEKAAKAKAEAQKGKIVIQPRAKIWIGKVNLATMQRSTVTTAKPIVLDNLKGRWIVATGHGRFSLKVGNRMYNFNDSKKHFLIIQKGTAHEIPHETFQKLNKSKVW